MAMVFFRQLFILELFPLLRPVGFFFLLCFLSLACRLLNGLGILEIALKAKRVPCWLYRRLKHVSLWLSST